MPLKQLRCKSMDQCLRKCVIYSCHGILLTLEEEEEEENHVIEGKFDEHGYAQVKGNK